MCQMSDTIIDNQVMITQIHMGLHNPSCPWQLHLTAGTKVPSSSPCPRLARALRPVLTVLFR